jgi:predicted GH43/DUF377 family glycosyl hydrolase
MWFSARNKSEYRHNKQKSYKIYNATSDDGINWKYNKTPSLNISKTGWDSIMVEYPYVVPYKNTYYMFYNGNGFGKEGIGYATKEDTFGMWE